MLTLKLTKIQLAQFGNLKSDAEKIAFVERKFARNNVDVSEHAPYLYTLKGHTVSIPPKD